MIPTDNLAQPSAHQETPLAGVLPPTPQSPAAPVDTVRVLHVINGEHYAGAERVQDLLAKNLPSLGFSAGFACIKLDLFDELRQSREAPLYDVPMLSRFDLLAAGKVARIARHGNYRILHTHTVRTVMIGSIASAITGIPMVYHVHSPISQNTTGQLSDRINSWIERWSLRRAVRVIAVSRAMADHIAHEGFDAARIAVVSNGVPALGNLPERKKPDGRWTLGTVALFRPRKGIEVLLDAMAQLRDRGLPIRLRAVGSFESPKYAAEIADRVERLGLQQQIVWTGFCTNVTDELRKMDIFVLPSLFGEGLPMAVLEAMAAGTPVVATRSTGIPEAIRDGRDGVLANPGNAQDLARALADVIEGRNDWSALRVSAWERQSTTFSDRSMAAGVAAVYREVLAEARMANRAEDGVPLKDNEGILNRR